MSTDVVTHQTQRKPRLTDQLLSDIPTAIDTLKDNVDYLRDAVNTSAGSPDLQKRLKIRLNALERSWWLSRFHAAVCAQREAGVAEDALS